MHLWASLSVCHANTNTNQHFYFILFGSEGAICVYNNGHTIELCVYNLGTNFRCECNLCWKCCFYVCLCAFVVCALPHFIFDFIFFILGSCVDSFEFYCIFFIFFRFYRNLCVQLFIGLSPYCFASFDTSFDTFSSKSIFRIWN